MKLVKAGKANAAANAVEPDDAMMEAKHWCRQCQCGGRLVRVDGHHRGKVFVGVYSCGYCNATVTLKSHTVRR